MKDMLSHYRAHAPRLTLFMDDRPYAAGLIAAAAIGIIATLGSCSKQDTFEQSSLETQTQAYQVENHPHLPSLEKPLYTLDGKL